MPLQNRVNPEGDICFSSARGTLMGNRGCLHDDARKIVSRSKRDAWITCLLEFKGRKSTPMTLGEYTELFFLDEATAFAAGHRPCWECRRTHYKDFLGAWGAANRPGVAIKAPDMDAQLKQDRSPGSRLGIDKLSRLPDGVIVKHIANGTHFLLLAKRAYPWSFDGYGTSSPLDDLEGPFIILTPASTVGAFRHGYTPDFHPSAR